VNFMSQTFRLGVFIVISLAVLATAVFLIGNQESMFKAHYRIKAEFQTVAGLQEGADVRVAGVRKGTVRRLQLPPRPDGKVIALMELTKDTQSIVKQDSVAAIQSEGLLGDKYVEISFGSDDAPKLTGGETIASQPPLDISDLMKKTNQILDTTTGAMANIQGATGNLNNITTKIARGEGTVGALVNDKTVYNKAEAAATSLADDMEALKHNFLLRGFFNKRGYVDSDELKKHEIAKLPAGPTLKAFDYEAKQIFDKPESAKLKNQKALNEVGQYLQGETHGLVVIVAATGMKGDSEKDRVLTQAQSMVIRNYFVQNFRLDDTRIKTMGLGKTDDAGEGGKVQVMVYPAEGKSSLEEK
jgi:phospholipid/cholesterol/gamma-HCH transport system substrate-binding protein